MRGATGHNSPLSLAKSVCASNLIEIKVSKIAKYHVTQNCIVKNQAKFEEEKNHCRKYNCGSRGDF